MEDNDTKNRILRGATELFAKYGFRSVSMDDIAHHLGISKKTIYQHFSDKDEIVNLTIAHHLSDARSYLQAISENASDAIDFLIKVNQRLTQSLQETASGLVLDLRKYHQSSWKQVENFRKAFLFQLLLRNIQLGIEAGVFRPDINADVIARLRLEEASMPLDSEVFPREKFDRATVSFAILDHFITGVSTEKGMKLYHQYKGSNNK